MYKPVNKSRFPFFLTEYDLGDAQALTWEQKEDLKKLYSGAVSYSYFFLPKFFEESSWYALAKLLAI